MKLVLATKRVILLILSVAVPTRLSHLCFEVCKLILSTELYSFIYVLPQIWSFAKKTFCKYFKPFPFILIFIDH